MSPADLAANPVVWIAAAAWLLTQSLKYLLAQRAGQPIKFSDPGGMPSSHAAVAAAVATMIGLRSGFQGDLFGLALVMAAIIAHDAYRVRWAVGEQARRLNDLLAVSKLPDRSLVVVWKGHRMREVLVGLLLGTALAGLAYWVLYG